LEQLTIRIIDLAHPSGRYSGITDARPAVALITRFRMKQARNRHCQMKPFIYDRKTAVITGASSGIGEAFARELARRGMHLVLVARSSERLHAVAAELLEDHVSNYDVIAEDLTLEGAASRIQSQVEERGLQVHLLINNAGFGTHGRFEILDPERDHQQVMLDVATVVDLAHAVVPGMVARGAGAIVNVASTAAFQPLPYMPVYSASKAFVLSFSEALAGELRGRGVRVLALCPGATETAFFDVAGQGISVGGRRTPEQVVSTGLRALEMGQTVVVDGTINALVAQAPPFLPRGLVTWIAGQALRPRQAVV
jgi:short-subunit dehydrogenase